MFLSPPARLCLLGLAVGLGLAGCEAQPLGSFQTARYSASESSRIFS